METIADTPTGGTALIVVPGVGDDRQGDTVATMTKALLVELGEGAHATPFTRRIVVPPLLGSSGPSAVHDVSCARIDRGDAAAPLVIYEMHWADLSRFPGTLRKFVLTLYGMLFQVASIGIEAFRGIAAPKWPQPVIRIFSYLTTVLVVGLTAGAAILGVEFAAMVRFTDRWQQLVIAGVALALVGGLAWFGDGFLRGNGWRFSSIPLGRPGIAFGAIALGIGLGPLIVHVNDATNTTLLLAVHEVLWFGVQWILPVAWGLVGATAVAISLTMLGVIPTAPGDPAQDRRYRANRTAVLSVVVGGLGIAVLGAVLVAAGLVATTAAVGGPNTGIPCRAAHDVGTDDCTFGAYSGKVFDYSLRPLGLALVCTLVLIVVLVVAGFRYFSTLVQASWKAQPPLAEAASIAVSVATLALLVATLVRASTAASDAVAVGLGVIALALVALYWARRFRPSAATRPFRRGFDALLAYLGSFPHVALLAIALFTAAVALILATPLTPEYGGSLARISVAIYATGVVVGAFAALVRNNLSAAAKALDVAYDVATYVRVPHGSPGHEPVEPPRRRILRRYATLVEHIQTVQKPDAIVIAAHSQGSMYSLALLFGDEFRDQADQQEVDGWPLAPRLTPDPGSTRETAPPVTTRLALLTAGCPILQTYAPNFPHQYDWPADTAEVDLRIRRLGPNTTWRNVYRSGDYLGRALWPEVETCAAPATRPRRRDEFCLGAGQHTGYWGDHRFATHVLALI